MVSETLRAFVYDRANGCCEYCRMQDEDRLIPYQIDHIIALKHGGTDDTENLCLACAKCNLYKGANVAGIDTKTDKATKLYHPRQQKWSIHFRLESDSRITGLTPEGRVTVFVLLLNENSRIQQRHTLRQTNRYPCQENQENTT